MKIRDWRTGGGYLRGIDVSSYQGTINFAKVKSNGIKYAILRAYGTGTGGTGDTRMKEYANGFKQVGIPCGSYFFCTISNEYDLASARTQANMYADKLEDVFGSGSWGQLTPFLDLENNENVGGRHASLNTTGMINWVKEFRKTFEARFNNRVKLGIYTSWYFIYDHNNFNNGALADMPLWMAKWRTTSINDVGGWTNWVMWQYTDNAYPFSSGQEVGVSSIGLDMNYTESLDDLMYNQPINVSTPKATLGQNNSITVTWTKPSLTSITKVELYRNGVLLTEVDKNSSTFIDNATAYGTHYSYYLIVYTSYDSKQSPTSNEVKTIIPKASRPTGLSIETKDRELTLSWLPNPVDDDVSGYTIYRNDEKVDFTEETSYRFLGLENGVTYNFQVQAHNRNPIPSDKSPYITGTPITDYPNQPVNLETTVKSNKEVDLTWNYAPKEDFSHFNIIVNGEVFASNVKNNSFTFVGLKENFDNIIKVIAYDYHGDSTESEEVIAKFIEPTKVRNLRGTAYDRYIEFEWDKVLFEAPAEFDNENLVINGYDTFESFTLDTQLHSTIASIDDEHAMDGERAIKLYHATGTNNFVYLGASDTDYQIPIDPTKRYIYSVHAYSEKTCNVQFHIRFNTAQTQTLYSSPTFVIDANKWTRLFFEVIPPTDATLGLLRLDVDQADTELWYDNIMLEVAQEWQEEPSRFKPYYNVDYVSETRERTIITQETRYIDVATTQTIQPYTITPYAELKEQALALTSYYETSTSYPTNYGVTVGDFDGAGLSHGAIQFNFKSGSLQPILKALFNNHTNVVKNAFNYYSNPAHYNTLRNVVFNYSTSQQIAWGSSITNRSNNNKLYEPYQTYFQNLGITKESIALQVKQAEWYFSQALKYYDRFDLKTRRGFALMFDITVQSGSISANALNLIQSDFNKINKSGKSITQIETEKLVIVANRKANEVSITWRESYRDRKLGIANGSGWVYNNSLFMDTTKYDMVLEPAFKEDLVHFERVETVYETIPKIVDVATTETYEVRVPVTTEPTEEIQEPLATKIIEVKNYLIFRNESLIASLDGTTSSYLDDNLENGKAYNYSVQAVSNQDIKGVVSNPLQLIPVTDYPNKAYNLEAEIKDDSTILFHWEVEEKENFAYFEVLLNDKVVATNTTINYINYEGAKQNFDYTLQVLTFDTDGDSVSSATITQRIEVPATPTNLKTIPKDREVTLTWDLNEEYFVNQYDIYVNDTFHVSVDSSTSNYVIKGLVNEVNYSFQIQAISDKGFTSELSDKVFGQPKLDIPTKPRIVYHKELGNGGVELVWEHSKKDLHSHYNVYKNGFLYAEYIESNSFQTDYLESNTTHSFQVQAFDSQGDRSGFSNSRFVTIYSTTLEPLSVTLGKVDKDMPVVKPNLYLCKPNKETIGKLSEAYNVTYNTRYADLNEILFNVPFNLDINNILEKNPNYEKTKERYLVRLELGNHVEFFIINEIQNSTENNSKVVHAWSLGYELRDKLITNFKEEIYTALSAFQIALDGVLNWQIGANIKNSDFYWNQETRIFDVSNQTVLDFIISIANSFNAVLVWDTVNRIVDFANPTFEDENRGLKVKYGKYLKSLSKTSSVEEMVTHLRPIGENNLSIREATVNGSDFLEDFSFFLNDFEMENDVVISHSSYMTDDLCKAIIAYNQLLESNEGIFRGYIDDKKILNEELVELEYELMERETNLFIIQDLLDSLKAEGTLYFENVTYGGVPRDLTWELNKNYKYILMAKTSNVEGISIELPSGTETFIDTEWTVLNKISFDRTGETTVESSIDEYDYNLAILGLTSATLEFQLNRILIDEFIAEANEEELLIKYNEDISQAKYDEQEQIVNDKKTEIEVVNTNIETLQSELSIYNNFSPELRKERDLFVITKEYVDEMIANPEELKNRAIEKFKELKNPVVTIQIEIVNLLEVLEEHYNWQKLELGTIINVFYDKFEVYIQAKIIQMDFDFDNKMISLTISNVNDIKTNQEKFINALYGAISTSTTVSIEKHNWSKAMEVREDFDSFVNKEFDATKQKIIAGTNETVEISRRGLLIKSDVDPNSFLVANASVLAITNDGGKSYKNAITTTGIIGERIVGKILAGENLLIENSAGTFKVDGDGVTISNQALKIVGGITQDQLSDDVDFQTDLSGIVGTYIDTYKENIDIATVPLAPTLTSTNGEVIQYTDVTDDLVNISFDWTFEEDGTPATNLDGFMIYLYASTSSALYTFGNNTKAELSFHVKPDKRSVIFYNVPKDLNYTFGVESYRVVNTDINSSGVLTSSLIQVAQTYNPKNYIPYNGDIIGTINYGKEVKVKAEILTAIRQGMSYDNVTIDSVNGLQVENDQQNQKTVINSLGFRLQTNDGTGYKDKLWATATGLVADDLTTNRLIVNDGTGLELINARTRQINFDNFDVVTGNIYAKNIQLRGLEVVNDNNIKTLTIDLAGNVSLEGNVVMKGGNITWGVVNAPNYESIGGVKPPTDANNTLLELMNNNNIKGFYEVNGQLYLYASYITGGIINADLIQVGSINADLITSGEMSFNHARGGVLQLGGAFIEETADGKTLYENGVFIVTNEQGENIAELNGNYGGFGTLRIDELKDTKNVVFTTFANIFPDNYDSETESIYFYVDPYKGNDDNVGTKENPKQTIQPIIDSLPKYLERNVYIKVLPTLVQDSKLEIKGFIGHGRLYIEKWELEIRYVREWMNGNTVNTGNHWTEFHAVLDDGTKVGGNYKPTSFSKDNGIAVGGATNVGFGTNQGRTGSENYGEIRVDTSTGNKFYHPNGKIFTIAPSVAGTLNETEVDTHLENNQPAIYAKLAYIGSDPSRFAFPYEFSSRDFILIKYNYSTNQWEYDNNSTFVPFTPNSDDCIIREYRREADTTTGIGSTWSHLTYTVEVAEMTTTTSSAEKNRLELASDYHSGMYDYYSAGSGNQYVQIYLRNGYKNIDYLHIWHYYNGARSYKDIKVEVSEDNITWYTIFTTERQGLYEESDIGKKHSLKRFYLNGSVFIEHCSTSVYVSDIVIDARYDDTIDNVFYAFRTQHAELNRAITFGSTRTYFNVYASNSYVYCAGTEVNYSSQGGIASAYNGCVQILNCKGAGHSLYGHYATNGGIVSGYGTGLYGDVNNSKTDNGGIINTSWTPTYGEFSPKPVTPEEPAPPPAPKIVQKTQTWTNSSADSWAENFGTWKVDDNDVLQGKYSSYGLYRGCWFFGTSMRNTVNGKTIKKIRVYVTRANSSGNSLNSYLDLRWHGYSSKPSYAPTMNTGDVKTVQIDRGQSMWVDVTSAFKSAFETGKAYGIGIYTSSTNSNRYIRMTQNCKVEITYETEA